MQIYTANVDLYLFFFSVFSNIYTHHKHLKNQNKKTKKKNKKTKKSPADKKTFFLKNKDLYTYSIDIPKTTFVSFHKFA